MTQDLPDMTRSAEFVLGLLSPEERLAFSGQMISDAALRAEVTFWSEHFAAFGGQAAPVDPPADVFRSVSEDLFGPTQPAATALQWARRVAGVLLIVACGWTLGAPFLTPENPRDNDLRAVLRNANGGVIAHAVFDPDTARIYVQRVLGAAALDRTYEIWLIADGDVPVSLGALPDQDQIRFKVAKDQRSLMARTVIALSQEHADMLPHAAPSGPVVAIAPLKAR